MSSSGRESWNTRVGFIFAAIGSAVGLGNMWRFPYMVAENGGAAFVLLYVCLLFLIGLPVMVSEFVLGRGSGASPIPALSQPEQPSWRWLGVLFVASGFLILSYYSVVAGWTIQYLLDSLTGHLFTVTPEAYFSEITFGHSSFMFHLLFMVLTIGVVLGGVERGIEICVEILVPVLVVMMLFLVAWTFLLPGASEGYAYYLQPELQNLVQVYGIWGMEVPFLDLAMLGAAAGQTFFTLSLGMGAMITYSSYLNRERDLFQEGAIISLSDLTIALLAGLMVFPFLTAFGLLAHAEDHEISTLFESVHAAFSQIGGLGSQFFGTVFFATLMVAALTSAISLLEVVTSSLMDRYDLPRLQAAAGSGFLIFLLGIPAAYRSDWLAVADGIAANLMLLFGGLMLAVYVGWIMHDPERELSKGQQWNVSGLWLFCLRYLVVPVLFLLFVQNLYNVLWNVGG